MALRDILKIPEAVTRMFERPKIIFTVKGNPRSEEVVAELQKQSVSRPEEDVEYRIFASTEEAVGSIDQMRAVGLSDVQMHKKCFTPCCASRPFDRPIAGAQWGVKIGPRTAGRITSCANQIHSDFVRKFSEQLDLRMFPWGRVRTGETPPQAVELPQGMDEVLRRLNEGPDMMEAISDEKYALELPENSRISWKRVPPPFIVDRSAMEAILDAFAQFEMASNRLLEIDPEVRELLLAGVDLPEGSVVRDIYLSPANNRFSVRRPDLHCTPEGIFASENDEMPGGFSQVFHLDDAYGLNQESWLAALSWLTQSGPLLFVVSSDWSSCYINETKWFAEMIVKRGFRARMITTDRISELRIGSDGVYHDEERIGTIWRLFPIFETTGMLAELVEAAHAGVVRMIPEFSHFGNKSWFSIFRSHRQFYADILPPDAFAMLDLILPHSQIVRSGGDFPIEMVADGKTFRFGTLDDLRLLRDEDRNHFVLKVCGANTEAARSYGVFMGHNLTDAAWQSWIDERIRKNQPFIIQSRFRTAVKRVPVLNTKRGVGEVFNCRVLLRPWHCDDGIISISATAVPSYTEKVHGMVDMALGPVILQ